MLLDINHEYYINLAKFAMLITTHINDAKRARGADTNAIAFYQTGRKFDRIFVVQDGVCRVRYFIDNENGEIYGAKSINAPNIKWYFGNIARTHLWDWSDWHGQPVNDPSVRLVKRYGPYSHYMKID